MQVDILNIKGAKTGRTIELPEEIFGAEPNNHVIYLAVKQYLAAQRQGTHKVKTRAEANGASKKLVKQKERKVKQIKDIIGDEQIEEPTQQTKGEYEIEERVIKKPKKKRIVYREESDSEEEVIVKSRQKTTKKTIIEEPNPKQMFKINFC